MPDINLLDTNDIDTQGYEIPRNKDGTLDTTQLGKDALYIGANLAGSIPIGYGVGLATKGLGGLANVLRLDKAASAVGNLAGRFANSTLGRTILPRRTIPKNAPFPATSVNGKPFTKEMYNSAARLHNALVGLGYGSLGGVALDKYGSDIGNAILSNLQDTPANATTVDTPSSTPIEQPLLAPTPRKESEFPTPIVKAPVSVPSGTTDVPSFVGAEVPTNQYGYSRTSPRSSWIERKGGINNGHYLFLHHYLL